MNRTSLRRGAARAAIGLTFLLGACAPGNQPAAPNSPLFDVSADQTPGYGVMVCKVGPVGTYSFTVSASGGSGWSYPNGTTFTIDVTQAYADLMAFCKQAWAPSSDLSAPAVDVTVGEVVASGQQLDSIIVYRDPTILHYYSPVTQATVPAGATYSTSYYVKFFNSEAPPPPPPSGQGCTPGYWKQSQHFGSWTAPYTPTTLFGSVFANAFPGKNLLYVLGLGGGGLNALGRHTVAALLDAADPNLNYGMSVANVISAFNAAYASGDYDTQKNVFAAMNELDCTLGLNP